MLQGMEKPCEAVGLNELEDIFMSGLKITVIGVGSTYTPELINGLITKRHQLEISQLSNGH